MNEKELLYTDVPVKMRNALQPRMEELKKPDIEDSNGECIYRYVYRQSGTRGTHNRFLGWQTQISVGNEKPLRRIALTKESILGAFFAVAAIVDKRLQFQESAHSWLLYMIHNTEAVDIWLDQVSVQLSKPYEVTLRGNPGKRKRSAIVEELD